MSDTEPTPEPEPEPPDAVPAIVQRGENAELWLKGLSEFWANVFAETIKILTGIEAGLRAGDYGYGEHLALAAMFDPPLDGIAKAKQFFINEGWQTAREQGVRLQAEFLASGEAEKGIDEVDEFLKQLGEH